MMFLFTHRKQYSIPNALQHRISTYYTNSPQEQIGTPEAAVISAQKKESASYNTAMYECKPAHSKRSRIGWKQSIFNHYAAKTEAPIPNSIRRPREELGTPFFDNELSTALNDKIMEKDESFQQMLLRLIDEHGLKDSECYKRALIDRRHFSRIRSNAAYQPTKPTAVAFAVALKLNMDETIELLKKAGFALSKSNVFDIIITYYIECKIYDIYEINYALEYYDQPLLGSRV